MVPPGLVLALIGWFFGHPGLGSENQPQKPILRHEVVVTATRMETPVREIASSVTVITKQELEASRARTVIEALQDVLGLAVVQAGPAGGSASVFLRGANTEHTLVMIDGVEINDPITPSRSCDLGHILLEDVERIEILRGPQSPLYGSDAIGGVIHIITEKGGQKTRFRTSVTGGSYRTWSGTAGVSGSLGRSSFALAASSLQSRGFSAASPELEGNREPDGYRNLSLSARWGFRASKSIDFDLTLKSVNTTTEIDAFGGPFGDDPNSVQDYDGLFLKGQVRGLFLRNRWEQIWSLSLIRYDRHHDNPTDALHPYDSEKSVYESLRWKIGWQNNLFLHASNTLSFGLEIQEESGESEYESQSQWGAFTSIFPKKKAAIAGLYIQDQLRHAGWLFMTAGIRLDSHTASGKSITYRIAPAVLLPQTQTKLRATLGTGFKAPSLYQLYAPGTMWGPIGNPDLEAEKTLSWDLGADQTFFDGNLLVGVTFFSSRFRNLIEYDPARGFVNIAKASSRGAEVLAEAYPSPDVSISASYTRTHTRDEATGEPLLRRPLHKLTTQALFRIAGKAHLTLSGIHVSAREDLEWRGFLPTRVRMPSYTLINAALSYAFSASVEAFCRVDNLLDVRYERIKGYGTPGISAYAGLVLNLE
ncbi:MAG: TonB-dependent receptor plug domain-containing protein [Candidatus Aminicenantales bacterium]